MPPVFDDYGDENNYFVESAPTTIVVLVLSSYAFCFALS
jgi:hypothetical protein